MTPGPPLPPLSALGRAAVERGVEKKNRRADMRGPAAAAASETGKRAGVGDVWLTRGAKWQRQLAKAAGRAGVGDALGHELGCCARVGAGLLLRARGPAERRCEGLGWSVGLVGAGRAGRACEAYFFFSFFCFSFLFHCLNSNLV